MHSKYPTILAIQIMLLNSMIIPFEFAIVCVCWSGEVEWDWIPISYSALFPR